MTKKNDYNISPSRYIHTADAETYRPIAEIVAELEIIETEAKKTDREFQQEIVQLGYRMVPYYHPIIAPCEINGKHLLVLWATGGPTRPYKAPVSLAQGQREFAYYIRKGSVTVRATHQDEAELMTLAATVPFDDRLNQRATLADLDLGLIRTYLKQIKSDLFDEAATMDFVQLCQRMNIVDGPEEAIYPKNVGLMFFNDHPETFFPQSQIDVVHFPDGPGADSFTERIFTGPLHTTLQDALGHIRASVIEEKIIKYPDRAEADRFFNYAYVAIEEALCNAVYHRSYEIREPVEVRILPDRITINSFPGPDRSIRTQDMDALQFLSQRYRNRRVGEFLKELDMTEGRGTGIPKMLRAIERNQSPLPEFYTDDDRSYFRVELPLHPAFAEKTGIKADTPPVTPPVAIVALIRLLGAKGPLGNAEILTELGLKDRRHLREHYIKPGLEEGLLEYTIPDKPTSRLQKYRLTEMGRLVLEEGGE